MHLFPPGSPCLRVLSSSSESILNEVSVDSLPCGVAVGGAQKQLCEEALESQPQTCANSFRGVYLYTCAWGPALGLMLCGGHLEILHSFSMHGPAFAFCTVPCKSCIWSCASG